LLIILPVKKLHYKIDTMDNDDPFVMTPTTPRIRRRRKFPFSSITDHNQIAGLHKTIQPGIGKLLLYQIKKQEEFKSLLIIMRFKFLLLSD
jgi:hypothetical protein